MARDEGSHPIVTTNDLVRYLRDNYVAGDNELLTQEDITVAINTPSAQEAIERGQRVGSFTYYIGDQIAEHEGWVDRGDEEDDDDDDI